MTELPADLAARIARDLTATRVNMDDSEPVYDFDGDQLTCTIGDVTLTGNMETWARFARRTVRHIVATTLDAPAA